MIALSHRSIIFIYLKNVAILIIILSSGIIVLSQGCILPKRAVDEIMIQSLKVRKSEIREAVEFSIGITYNSDLRQFPVDGINDSIMRKKMESLWSEVYVNYHNQDAPATVPDSTVIFTSIHEFGSIEIIFDFATNEREISTFLAKKSYSQLKKVGDRTYYRRGAQSLLY